MIATYDKLVTLLSEPVVETELQGAHMRRFTCRITDQTYLILDSAEETGLFRSSVATTIKNAQNLAHRTFSIAQSVTATPHTLTMLSAWIRRCEI